MYSMILQGDPVLQTLPWCSSCADTLRDFLHFCSLRLPTWDTEGSINARKWHFPLHRPAPSGSTCSCALFSSNVRSLPHSLPPPPPLFLSLSRFLSRSRFPSSLPLSPALSFTHAHTSLYLSTSFRLYCFLITLFVFNKKFLISCFNLHMCVRVCTRACASGWAGGRAGGRGE